jgi:LacI family transcriptional regulator
MRGDAKKFKIAPRTVLRVQAAARKLNYIPNASAQNLRRRRSHTVTIIVHNFRFDWADGLFSGAMEVLQENGLTAIVSAFSADPARQETEIVEAIRRRDAAVMCQPIIGGSEIYRRVMDANIPLILLGDYPLETQTISHVIWNADMAACAAVKHLVAIGRTRIGYVGLRLPLFMHIRRYAAYQKVLEDAKLPVNPDWIYRGDAGTATHEALLSKAIPHIFAGGHTPPDAIFAMNDGIAIPLIYGIEQLGYRVPRDIAVVGIGDMPMARAWGVSLTTVREPVREMGAEAARLAIDLIANPKIAPIHRVLPAGDLVVRRSTGEDGGEHRGSLRPKDFSVP